MQRAIIASVALLVLSGTAVAQSTIFTRVNQNGGLGPQQLAVTYGVEFKRNLAEREKEGQGGGGGGLGGGRSDYSGVHHRLALAHAVTRWLTLSLDQTLKQPQLDQLDVGVLVPELRINLSQAWGALAHLPLETSAVMAARVRINARRHSSAVLGLVGDRQLGPLLFTLRLAFETTLDNQQRENGARYQLGLGWRPLALLRLALEGWGALVWPDYGPYQQDHHAGPSIQLARGPLFAGVNAGVGMKERPHRIFVDLSIMGRLGLRY